MSNTPRYRIGIVGSGMIGSSMALLFTGNGYHVTMYAHSDQGADRGLQRYRKYCQDLIENNLMTEGQACTCEKLLHITRAFSDLSDVDIVFEALIENLEVKHTAYKEIEKYCPNVKVIASATSAMPVDVLAKGLERKEILIVAHPYNPPHLVPFVEIVKEPDTSEEAVSMVFDLLKDTGRVPVIMKKSAPGFIANRLQHALFREAVYMVEQGYTTPEDIDIALRNSFMPRYTSIGLFEHMDYAGLDMAMSIHKSLYPTLCNASAPQELVKTQFENGNLGYKTGKGILDWSHVDIDEFRKKTASPYLRFFNWKLPEP